MSTPISPNASMKFKKLLEEFAIIMASTADTMWDKFEADPDCDDQESYGLQLLFCVRVLPAEANGETLPGRIFFQGYAGELMEELVACEDFLLTNQPPLAFVNGMVDSPITHGVQPSDEEGKGDADSTPLLRAPGGLM